MSQVALCDRTGEVWTCDIYRVNAVRKPKDNQALQMGDIVQPDRVDIRPLPSAVLKHSPPTMWSLGGMPFPIKATQVDGGSEFQALCLATTFTQAKRRGRKGTHHLREEVS